MFSLLSTQRYRKKKKKKIERSLNALVSTRYFSCCELIIRVFVEFRLQNLETNLWRDVTHLWYGGWPVQGVPSDPGTMMAFLMEARSHMKSNSGPHVVHCSPGTARTGTVIACDIVARDFEQSRSVDIPKTVYSVRRCRAGAVQTRDQYAFIYKVYLLEICLQGRHFSFW